MNRIYKYSLGDFKVSLQKNVYKYYNANVSLTLNKDTKQQSYFFTIINTYMNDIKHAKKEVIKQLNKQLNTGIIIKSSGLVDAKWLKDGVFKNDK